MDEIEAYMKKMQIRSNIRGEYPIFNTGLFVKPLLVGQKWGLFNPGKHRMNPVKEINSPEEMDAIFTALI